MTDSKRTTPDLEGLHRALLIADVPELAAELRSVGLNEVATCMESLAAEVERLTALRLKGILPGHKLVPVEPNSEMKRAAQKASMFHGPHRAWLIEEWDDHRRVWAAMLAAAPAHDACEIANLVAEHVTDDEGPKCRDCADFGPICPNSGKPCGASKPAQPDVLSAVDHACNGALTGSTAAPSRGDWDDGYVEGVKACVTVVRAAIDSAIRVAQPAQPERGA